MFEQVKLNYDFASLEPHIDELTMQTHYGKHHAGYTNNLNNALEKLPQLAGKSIEEILSNLATIEDAALRTAVRNNGGGYYNHNLYFDILSPAGGQPPQGKLAEQIKADFNSFDELVQKLTSTAASVFGSGWAWLSKDPSGKLVVTSTPNQDNPLMTHGGQLTPILGIDVWEHAYYLKYKNMRADYLKAIFNVIDWNNVAQRYTEA
ncbi:MAG: superoxide dismutase [Limnochordia bacterium]|mgnify:FL=1|jgi:Fe-Mn family superoxide dismutase|nr:superoxide dismutase [Bacillota bacterium]HBG09422.1 superoxide dismutase [Bacillota bacterium]